MATAAKGGKPGGSTASGHQFHQNMKTYAECEQEVERQRAQAMSAWTCTGDPIYRSAREAGFLQSLATQLLYENELLRDQSNTREMYALLERLGGK